MKKSTRLTRMMGGSVGTLQKTSARSNRVSAISVAASRSSAGSFVEAGYRFGRPWMNQRSRWGMRPNTMYQLTDRLHDGHIARVSGNAIAATVSSWLADLGAQSPLVDDLARAVQHHDWPATYAIGEILSVDVAVAS
jgi:hypothetical protein